MKSIRFAILISLLCVGGCIVGDQLTTVTEKGVRTIYSVQNSSDPFCLLREFDISLDELHNDSTTVSFCGEYPEAESEQILAGQMTPAITWGHSKDHRPDLKQLLYILPVKLLGTNDGGVPIYFQAASGNVVDDQTHQATWKLMAELTGRKDFVYVADCKKRDHGTDA